jgi:hypothetical protein
MANEILKYDRMVENALRSVVREALTQVSRIGLPGSHHFYITFRTGHPGVVMPEYLRLKYPQEMTIVLQFQFWGLEVEAEHFAITLSFSDVHERLSIPYGAITGFADPSVKFGLQFQANEPAAGARLPVPAPMAEKPAAEKPATAPASTADKPADAPPASLEGGGAKVVTLNSFRKK